MRLGDTLFHVKLWERCCHWTGRELSAGQGALLRRYRDWLLTEAMAGGGIGPNESGRIDNRHIGDSLVFAGGFQQDPIEVLDAGSGVGLPGIPLAILMPQTRFHLLDRSGRRVELTKRVVRILDLANVEVVHADIADWDREVDGIVSRGSLSPEEALTSFNRILGPHGVAVVGGSWASRPEVAGFEPLQVPAAVLDQTVWLLIMRRQ
jgi:16S rRNA (guanine(527)-N(7))-methyltransferase RsmG